MYKESPPVLKEWASVVKELTAVMKRWPRPTVVKTWAAVVKKSACVAKEWDSLE
jgi:hypothetical protein